MIGASHLFMFLIIIRLYRSVLHKVLIVTKVLGILSVVHNH